MSSVDAAISSNKGKCHRSSSCKVGGGLKCDKSDSVSQKIFNQNGQHQDGSDIFTLFSNEWWCVPRTSQHRPCENESCSCRKGNHQFRFSCVERKEEEVRGETRQGCRNTIQCECGWRASAFLWRGKNELQEGRTGTGKLRILRFACLCIWKRYVQLAVMNECARC